MIGITTTRAMAAKTHPPAVVFVMLFGLGLTAALLAHRRPVGHELGTLDVEEQPHAVHRHVHRA